MKEIHMKYFIRKIPLLKTGMIAAFLLGFFGMVSHLLIILWALVKRGEMPQANFASFGFLIFSLYGFLITVIICWFYNLIINWFGGFEVELTPSDQELQTETTDAKEKLASIFARIPSRDKFILVSIVGLFLLFVLLGILRRFHPEFLSNRRITSESELKDDLKKASVEMLNFDENSSIYFEYKNQKSFGIIQEKDENYYLLKIGQETGVSPNANMDYILIKFSRPDSIGNRYDVYIRIEKVNETYSALYNVTKQVGQRLMLSVEDFKNEFNNNSKPESLTTNKQANTIVGEDSGVKIDELFAPDSKVTQMQTLSPTYDKIIIDFSKNVQNLDFFNHIKFI